MLFWHIYLFKLRRINCFLFSFIILGALIAWYGSLVLVHRIVSIDSRSIDPGPLLQIFINFWSFSYFCVFKRAFYIISNPIILFGFVCVDILLNNNIIINSIQQKKNYFRVNTVSLGSVLLFFKRSIFTSSKFLKSNEQRFLYMATSAFLPLLKSARRIPHRSLLPLQTECCRCFLHLEEEEEVWWQ